MKNYVVIGCNIFKLFKKNGIFELVLNSLFLFFLIINIGSDKYL